MNRATPSPPSNPDAHLVSLLRLIVDSHFRIVRKPLLSGVGAQDPRLEHALWNAAQAVVAHGTQADPIFFYGNRLALELFEMDFSAFTALPSRYSAEPLAREARAALLQRVARDGFIDDYAGIRISRSGRRFRIENATVWNLIDTEGVYLGQAATFSDWQPA